LEGKSGEKKAVKCFADASNSGVEKGVFFSKKMRFFGL
jgi:hypothetical protein